MLTIEKNTSDEIMKHPLTWGFEKTRVGKFACKFVNVWKII
jgi:hypothetical protein